MAEVKAAMVSGPNELQTLWVMVALTAMMENWTAIGTAILRCCLQNCQFSFQSSFCG